jgi:hypothetical protein
MDGWIPKKYAIRGREGSSDMRNEDGSVNSTKIGEFEMPKQRSGTVSKGLLVRPTTTMLG